MSESAGRTFWQERVYPRPTGRVSARLFGVRRELEHRADSALRAALREDRDSQQAAALRGKSHAYREAVELLDRLTEGRRIRGKRWWA